MGLFDSTQNATLSTPGTLGSFAPTPNPAIATGLSIGTDGNALSNGLPVFTPPSTQANLLLGTKPPVMPTATGGLSFNPSLAQGFNAPAITPQPTPSSTPAPLTSYINNTQQTPNGSTFSSAGGQVNGFTPNPGYSIDTSTAVPSEAFGSGANPYQTHSQYSDYVNALAQAQGYSPAYIGALNQQYGAQTQGAALEANAANINANQAVGIGTTGLNTQQAGTLTGQELALNSQAEQGNAIRQLSANQALNTQQLARTGAISAAQTQLEYSPTGISGANAINQYNALQQAYPSANLPAFNPQQDPLAQLQMAHAIVSNSAQFQQQFLQQYTTPGGGTGIYNSLKTGLLTPGPNGTIQLVSGADAQLGAAQTSALSQAVGTYNTLKPAFQAANNDFTAMTQFMQQAGINDSSVPIINQINNKVKAGTVQAGAVGAFQSYVASLRTNYANLLGARGETPTQAGATANTLIPDNLGVKDMLLIQQALNTNGGNILDATGQQIDTILNASRTGQTGVSGFGNNTSQGSGSIYDF